MGMEKSGPQTSGLKKSGLKWNQRKQQKQHKKAWSKLACLFLAATLAFGAPLTAVPLGSPALATAQAAAKSIRITNLQTGTLTLEAGETFRLEASRPDVKWKSSNPKVVSVNQTGKLKAVKNGAATVTAKAGSAKASVKVTVGTKVARVNVIKPAVALLIGQKSTIKAAVFPADASNQAVTYQPADKGIASVSKTGVITAKKSGRTKITVTAADGTGERETVTVTVRPAGSAVRLQDDFYQAMNQTVLTEHALLENQYQWNGFYELQENITKNLSTLIDGLVAQKDTYAPHTIEQKIVDFYLLARDMEARDKAGVEPLRPYISQIDGAQTVAEFVQVLAQMGKCGIGSVFQFQIAPDLADSNRYALTDAGPNVILPKDYMLGEENQAIQQAALAFIKQMFVLAGEDEAKAGETAAQVFQFEQDLAASGMGLEDRYDVTKFYHPYTKEEFKELYSNCDIEGYLKEIGITDFEQCIVYEEENAKKINSYLTKEHLELLKNYTKFTIYTALSNYLTSAHYTALQEFNALITGAVDGKSMDTVAKEMTQGLFAWEFGKLYTDQYFSKESKQEIEEMTRQLIKTFRNRLTRINWLSDATKQKAMQKLDTMKVKIGYPDKWPSYFDGIAIDASKGLIENLIQIQEAVNADAQQTLESGVDKDAWIMTPQTVNACYNPQANDITFPAAILQAPFYDKDADAARNLGGIGTVIGHEITHAFDTNGATYDENGNYSSWWTKEDIEQFMARAQKVKDYYNSIEVTNGVFQNGDMTITENIADMGAMACALEIAGDDKKAQLEIFISNANIWASNQSDQYRDYLLTVDAHSLNKVRVNAILPLFSQFYDVFGVTKNDAMYVEPKDRVQIW